MFKLTLKACRKNAGYKSQSEAAKALGMKERRYASLEREEVALTLEDAYDAYIAALNNEKYDEVRGSSGQ